MSRITWGVDGYGIKHYLCDYCYLVFGNVDKDSIEHECDTSRPRYHNRDKQHDTITASQSGRAKEPNTSKPDYRAEPANLEQLGAG